jgi:hypothetical protein
VEGWSPPPRAVEIRNHVARLQATYGQRNSNGDGDNRAAPRPAAAAAPAPRMGTRRDGGPGPATVPAVRLRPSPSQAVQLVAGARPAHPPRRRHGERSRYVRGVHPTSYQNHSFFLALIHPFRSVCLDGTPPGYHLQRGSGDGANKWLVHLEVVPSSISHPFFS